jgi:hypothetical protein
MCLEICDKVMKHDYACSILALVVTPNDSVFDIIVRQSAWHQ